MSQAFYVGLVHAYAAHVLPPPAQWGAVRRTTGRLLPALSMTGMLILHAAEALVAAPSRYPDLYSVAFAAYSCSHFVCFYLAAVYMQWRIGPTEPPHTPLDGASGVRSKED